jgi:hypothetical protein
VIFRQACSSDYSGSLCCRLGNGDFSQRGIGTSPGPNGPEWYIFLVVRLNPNILIALVFALTGLIAVVLYLALGIDK